MVKHIAAIAFIFCCTSVAWIVLGGTIMARTDSAGDDLHGRIESNWGTPQLQTPPVATYDRVTTETVTDEARNGKLTTRQVTNHTAVPVSIDSSRINVRFDLAHRQKGLLWYATYGVDFDAIYAFTNPTAEPQTFTVTLPLPAKDAVYDGLAFSIAGQPLPSANVQDSVHTTFSVAPHATVPVAIRYHSQGLDRWTYALGDGVAQVHDFDLQMHTNFADIDFPDKSLSPTVKRATPAGWDLQWKYATLISGFRIGMAMPQKLQPGPLAGQISFFAPVSLFFFFFVMMVITTLRGIYLHPMNYFFLASAFFAFHLLMAYLVDHISIHAAFVLCSLVSIFLLVSYLRLVIGMRFAALEAGMAQLLYLVLFSYAFFFKGFTGLSITVGAILTLFVVMQVTGRIDWRARFAAMSARG